MAERELVMLAVRVMYERPHSSPSCQPLAQFDAPQSEVKHLHLAWGLGNKRNWAAKGQALAFFLGLKLDLEEVWSDWRGIIRALTRQNETGLS